MCKLLQRFRLEYHHEPVELRQKFFSVPDKPVKIKFYLQLKYTVSIPENILISLIRGRMESLGNGDVSIHARNIAFRRNLLDFTKPFHKPFLTLFWRSQRTEAKQKESPETFDGVRSFDEIPEPNRWKFMYDLCTKTGDFAKAYKLTERLFHELGPLYKENLMLWPIAAVHVQDLDDFEKVFRAEGKYPRRLIFDFLVEHRKRGNHFPGITQVDGEEWHRLRQNIAPKLMRPKIVEENILNFNAVSKDAVARFVRLKEACE
ncbi:unnamed protein product [Porites lobata]|uniref:Uncharacterized protein n=1 Tax=Porites lobata TaxID=104759 RepID=A0ABN8NGF9_9CNID|nr:unnamed protein product [Porites lobata]